MTIQEIIDRIAFFNEIKIKRSKIKNVEFFQMLSNCIMVGCNAGNTGKNKGVKEFNRNLLKLLEKEEHDENDLDPEMVHKIIKRS